jgi:L-aspartate oxidase
MLEQGAEHMYLDARHFGAEMWPHRFPTILAACRAHGIDPVTEPIPVAPAAHYASGGVRTDSRGRTTVPGLYACGEVACTGVHGANRLASNSLLEGMVFAPRVVEAIAAGKDGPDPTGAMRAVLGGETDIPGRTLSSEPGRKSTWDSRGFSAENDAGKARERIQRAMTAGAGVLRDARSLSQVAGVLARTELGADTPAWHEVGNLATVGAALVASATAREESRGAHARSDFAATDDAFRCRLVLTHG